MALSPRRSTPTVTIRSVAVGSSHPVVVQSMTNTDTADVPATIHQVAALARAGLQASVQGDSRPPAGARLLGGFGQSLLPGRGLGELGIGRIGIGNRLR